MKALGAGCFFEHLMSDSLPALQSSIERQVELRDESAAAVPKLSCRIGYGRVGYDFGMSVGTLRCYSGISSAGSNLAIHMR